ncbi:MAG: C1 family peptidase [Terracidiphilus sp.]|jgi:C1A family cysteine protease
MAITQESLTALQNTLEAEGATWTAGKNKFFGMTDEELKRRLGCRPDPNGPSPQEQEAQAKLNLQQHALPRGGFPSSFDWRNRAGRNFISAIKDQGACGSCTAFGTCATLDARIRIIRDLAVSDPNGYLLTDLSEAQLFYCGNPYSGPCEFGMLLSDAMNYSQSNGLGPEFCFPYTSGDQQCAVSANWGYMITQLNDYHSITDVNDMKIQLWSNGPLIAPLTIYSDFYSYTSGVYRRTSGSVMVGYHCVSCIGYSEPLQAWLCKNSWGENWGESGFFWIGYGECGIDSQMYSADNFSQTFPEPGSVCHIDSFMVGLVMEVRGSETAPGAVVDSGLSITPWPFNQLWVFTSDGHIMNPTTGLVLSIAGGSMEPGTPVLMATQDVPSSWYQIWQLTPDGHIASSEGNLVLDITGGSWNWGTPIQVWTKNSPNSNNQLWRLSYLPGILVQ